MPWKEDNELAVGGRSRRPDGTYYEMDLWRLDNVRPNEVVVMASCSREVLCGCHRWLRHDTLHSLEIRQPFPPREAAPVPQSAGGTRHAPCRFWGLKKKPKATYHSIRTGGSAQCLPLCGC